MAQEYYTLERAAEVLKISTGEVNRMREQSQLRAFRDGSNWKFRKEDVEEALAAMIRKKNQVEEEEEDVLTFGLVDENESDELPTLMADTNMGRVAEADDLSLDDGLSLADEDSDMGIGLELDETIDHDSKPTDRVDLAQPGPKLEEDDELVLGGSSDLNLSGDSGLSLADEEGNDFAFNPSDDDAALELDEDSDILALADSEEHSEVPTLLADGGDGNEFDLIADADDSDDSESSSQVIALEDESPFGMEEIPDLGGSGFSEMPAASSDFGEAAPLSSSTAAAYSSKPQAAPGPSPFEANYSGGWVTAMGLLCIVPVGMAGIMVYDLVRNIWSWNQPALLSSPLMNMIAGMLGWK